jgi:hypothetical protein
MQLREDRIGACVIWTIRYYSNGLFLYFYYFIPIFSGNTIHFAGKNSETAMGREHYFFRLGVSVKGHTEAYIGFFSVFSLFSPE